MIGPPDEVVLAIAVWLAVCVLLAGHVGWSLIRSPKRQATPGTCGSLLVMTALLPIVGLTTIVFDEFARDWWFPIGTPKWFVAWEILFWVGAWAVLAGLILFLRRPIRNRDWICTVLLGAVVTAMAVLLIRGIH